MKALPIILGLVLVFGLVFLAIEGGNAETLEQALEELFAPLILRGDDSVYPEPGVMVNPYPYPAPVTSPVVDDPIVPTRQPVRSTPTAYSNEPPTAPTMTPTAGIRPTAVPPTRPAPSEPPRPSATPDGDWWCSQHPDDPRCQPPPPPTPFETPVN